MKAKILKIGKIEHGRAIGWDFQGGDAGIEWNSKTGEVKLGGYTFKELKDILKNEYNEN